MLRPAHGCEGDSCLELRQGRYCLRKHSELHADADGVYPARPDERVDGSSRYAELRRNFGGREPVLAHPQDRRRNLRRLRWA